MNCTIEWAGPDAASGMSFHAATGTGHWLSMDGAPEAGGRNLAPRPMEMLLVGAGGCTAFDVVLILQRGRQPVSACTVCWPGSACSRRSGSCSACSTP